MLSCFPRGVLDEILNLIESVSEGFPSYSFNDENEPGNCKKARLDAVPQTLSVAISNDGARCQNQGKCNWCTQEKLLLPGKKFCHSCSLQGRECKWYHRPLPERFFSKRTDVCDRCPTRRENWITRQQHGGDISMHWREPPRLK